MFYSLACLSELDDKIKKKVADHLSTLKSEFKHYFLELDLNDLSIVRNPFHISIEQLDNELQDKLIDLKNDSGCRDLFKLFQSPISGYDCPHRLHVSAETVFKNPCILLSHCV